ncbi:hypothetical protein F2Q70_00037879 [Brassica cretica]|uniref:Uncharacterized protein n=1 Tax=Brassica cretica TaxID=69181 RepID=A0A8S9JWQ2_BRACR|nr:hypothetical protein F2Q70_00037879 [Brassica cretica]
MITFRNVLVCVACTASGKLVAPNRLRRVVSSAAFPAGRIVLVVAAAVDAVMFAAAVVTPVASVAAALKAFRAAAVLEGLAGEWVCAFPLPLCSAMLTLPAPNRLRRLVSSAAFPTGRIVMFPAVVAAAVDAVMFPAVVAAAVDAVMFPAVVTVASVAATLSGVVVTLVVSMGVLESPAPNRLRRVVSSAAFPAGRIVLVVAAAVDAVMFAAAVVTPVASVAAALSGV